MDFSGPSGLLLALPIVPTFGDPKLQILAPATTAIGRVADGRLFPKNGETFHPGKFSHLVTGHAVVGHGIVIIFDEETRDPAMELHDIRSPIPTLPMEPGELRRAGIHIAARTLLVVVNNDAEVREKCRVQCQHMIVDLQPSRALVAGLPALAS
jgi:hypothetical protein